MKETIATAVTEARDRLDDAKAHVEGFAESAVYLRNAAPTLTTALLLVVFALGGGAGWFISKPFVRHAVNTEWRNRIAQKSKTVRTIVATGDKEAEQADDDIIKALGDTDEKLSTAIHELEALRRAVPLDRCSVPADCVRIK
ncbi:MAG: hypothetical protein HOO99_03895 [Hyphomicrobiaceae bacterium]|nr:hypothetical protein [Hyphomicrobiaceae bacterium]